MTDYTANKHTAIIDEGAIKLKSLLFIALLLLAFQILVSFPIAVWLNNQFDLISELHDSLAVFALSFLVVSIGLFLIAAGLPKKVCKYLLPMIILVSILVYVQQYILVWDYGVLDGRRIDFSNNKFQGWIDLGIWIFGAVVYIFLREKILKHSLTILLFTAIMTIVGTVTTVVSHDFSQDSSTASLSEIHKFTYSDNHNVLLFLLDGFQSDLFWELIDQNPEFTRELSGFTFYSNTSAVFAKTYPTIPLLLTGKSYQKQEPFQTFLDDVYQDSILTDLVSEGWDVGLYPYVKGTIPLDNSIMSNYLSYTPWPEKVDDYLQTLDLTLFRSVPHVFKNSVYNNGDFIIKNLTGNFLHSFDHLFIDSSQIEPLNSQPHQGLNFRENLSQMGKATSPKPSFRFYHLFMPHEPFLLDQNLEFGRTGNDFSSYQEYAFASLKLMISYLSKLKALGIYDNTSIIITADHGSGEYSTKTYNSDQRIYQPSIKNGKAMASGKPLLLIKNGNSDEPLNVSSKPVSLLDVAPTIAHFANIEIKNVKGRTIDSIGENEQRVRTYFHYTFSGWDSRYLNDFDVYRIDGDVYDDDSWTKTGKLTANSSFQNNLYYELGSTIRFGSDIKIDSDYQNAFLLRDDYEITTSHVSSADGQLELSIDLDTPLNPNEMYVLEIDLQSTVKDMEVELEVTETSLHSFSISKNHNELVFLNPKRMSIDDQFHFRLNRKDETLSKEQFLLSKIKLSKANLSSLNNTSELSFADNLDGYFIQGTWAEEPWGRWTAKKESTLYFLASDDFCKNTHLLLDVNAFFADVDPDSLKVHMNGKDLNFIRAEYLEKSKRYHFDCSGFENAAVGVNVLAISTDKVRIPLVIGKSNDPRPLGVGLIGLRFEEKEAFKPTQLN